jgi:hypothetical protein
VSGIVFGTQHDLLSPVCDAQEMESLFDTAERYIRQAHSQIPAIKFFQVFINGGPKSAASVDHAHAQVVGRQGRPFGHAQRVMADVDENYWSQQAVSADELGLAFRQGNCVAWPSLVPIKDRDVTAISPSLAEGARFISRVLEVMANRGTLNFSLTAIISPKYLGGAEVGADWSHWPTVLWRIVDRGDPAVAHSDIGCMELFGTPVVTSDPFIDAHWLQSNLGS